MSWSARTKVRVWRIVLLPCCPTFLLLLASSHPFSSPLSQSDLIPLIFSIHPLCWSSQPLPWLPPCPQWVASVPRAPGPSLLSCMQMCPCCLQLSFPTVGVFSLLASTSAFQTGSPAQLLQLHFLICSIGSWKVPFPASL